MPDSPFTVAGQSFRQRYGNYGNYLLTVLRGGRQINLDNYSATLREGGFANTARLIKDTRNTKVVVTALHIFDRNTNLIHHYDIEIYRFTNNTPSDPLTWEVQKDYSLREDEVQQLRDFLNEMNELIGQPMPSNHAQVVYSDQTASVDDTLANVAAILKDADGDTQAVIGKLLDVIVSAREEGSLPSLVISPAQLEKKKAELDELEVLIGQEGVREVGDIQAKLKTMPWVFGPEYINYDFRRAGEDMPDGRLKRVDGLSDILEVKLPSEEVLRVDGRGRRYIAPKCSESLGQLVSYLEYYLSEHRIERDDETGEEIQEDTLGKYYRPKGILLIGRRLKSNMTANVTAKTSDALPKYMRRQMTYFHGLEVLTYDDLIERARNGLAVMAELAAITQDDNGGES